jgi:hypothetical protein
MSDDARADENERPVPAATGNGTEVQISDSISTVAEQWLAIRKEAALKIDPETAEVEWWYAQTLDPYGVNPELPEEYQQVGREYFARSPGSDVWVWFGDLPDAIRSAFWDRITEKIGDAFVEAYRRVTGRELTEETDLSAFEDEETVKRMARIGACLSRRITNPAADCMCGECSDEHSNSNTSGPP